MLPVFKPGEVVLLSAVSLKRGDCAVYEFNGATLLHRVIRTGREGVWFSDDAGRLEPHFVPLRSIKGKAVSSNPLTSGFCGFIYSALRRRLSSFRNA